MAIRAIMIVEVAGRPAEHVAETLKKHISQLNKAKTIRILKDTYSEPKKVEGQEMYTNFAEVEVEGDTFLDMVNLVFDYMPSSFEIISPENIEFNLSDATSLLNTLSGRLHRYDEIARMSQFQVQKLLHKFKEMQKQDNHESSEKKDEKKEESGSDKAA